MSWQQHSQGGAIPYAVASLEDELLFQQLQQQQHQQQQQQHQVLQQQQSIADGSLGNIGHHHQLLRHRSQPLLNQSSLMQEKIMHPPTPDCPPLDQSQVERIARQYIDDPSIYNSLMGGGGAYSDALLKDEYIGSVPLQTPMPTSEDLITNQHLFRERQRQLMNPQAHAMQRQQTLPASMHSHSHSQHYVPPAAQRRLRQQSMINISDAYNNNTYTSNNSNNTNYDDFDFLTNYQWSANGGGGGGSGGDSMQAQAGLDIGMSTNAGGALLRQHTNTSGAAHEPLLANGTQRVRTAPPAINNNYSHHAHQLSSPNGNNNNNSSSQRPNYGLGVSMPSSNRVKTRQANMSQHPIGDLPPPVPARTIQKKPSYIFSNSSVDDMSRSRIVKKKSSRNLRKAKKDLSETVKNSIKTPAKQQHSIDYNLNSSPTTIPMSAGSTVKRPRDIQQQIEFQRSQAAPQSPTPAGKYGHMGGGGLSPRIGVFRSVSASIREANMQTSVQSEDVPRIDSSAPTASKVKSPTVAAPGPPSRTPDLTTNPTVPLSSPPAETNGDRLGGLKPSLHEPTDHHHQEEVSATQASTPPPSTGTNDAKPAIVSTMPISASSDSLLAGFDFETLNVPEPNWDEFQSHTSEFTWNALDASEELARHEL